MAGVVNGGKYKQIFSDYERGMFILQAQETILHYNPLIGLFPNQKVNTKDVTIVEELPIDKYDDKLPKGKRLAKGASARRFRGELTSPKGFTMVKNAIEYVIDKEDMENEYFQLTNEVQAMSFILGKDMTKTIFDVMKKYAKPMDTTKMKLKWGDANTEYSDILNDIVRMKKQLRDKNINKIDNFVYGDEAITTLAAKSQVESTRYEFQKEGFYVDDTMRISGANHFWGGMDLDDGEVYGFNYAQPALQIFYKKPSNPHVQNVPSIPGYEEVTPAVNMLMYDNSDTEEDPQVTIKMSCTMGAYPIGDGNKMVKLGNIL